jgi:hypothetical protein
MRYLAIIPVLALTACAPATTAPQRAQFDAIAVGQEVLAVERAFAERVQREGQWTAFRATMAPQAWLFVPDSTDAGEWLAGRADPPQSVRWQPHRVVVSCDGTMAATTGAAQFAGGRHGYYTTIWRRMDDGNWRWEADYGDDVAAPLPPVSTPLIEVAECPGSEGPEPQEYPRGMPIGISRDGTMAWEWIDSPMQRGLRVTIWIGPRYVQTIQFGPPSR